MYVTNHEFLQDLLLLSLQEMYGKLEYGDIFLL